MPIHPGGGNDEPQERRGLVVRAPTSPEEQEFFETLKDELKAPTMADMIRYLAAECALDVGIELPERWRPYYKKRKR